tara:strand:- start:15708 stop:15851 length:144 start_codon:yes stop_codon:yes gene_type:complete
LVASVPLSANGWLPMAEGEMVALRDAVVVETLLLDRGSVHSSGISER